MFLKRWLALLLILAAPVLWADESCSLSECRYHVPLDRSGTYIAVVTLPSGQAEGLWSLIINPGQFSPQYLNGFWAGSVLKEQSQLPSWVAFSLSQTTPINITPYDWIGDGSPLTLQIDKDIGGGQRQLVYGPTLMNQGQTYTTQPLDPGFYITGLFSQPESVRTYRGLALEGHGLFGGVVGGYLDSFSGVGYGAFIISSPEIVEFLLVFGDTFGSLGASQPRLDIYYQHEDGTRELSWSRTAETDLPPAPDGDEETTTNPPDSGNGEGETTNPPTDSTVPRIIDWGTPPILVTPTTNEEADTTWNLGAEIGGRFMSNMRILRETMDANTAIQRAVDDLKNDPDVVAVEYEPESLGIYTRLNSVLYIFLDAHYRIKPDQSIRKNPNEVFLQTLNTVNVRSISPLSGNKKALIFSGFQDDFKHDLCPIKNALERAGFSVDFVVDIDMCDVTANKGFSNPEFAEDTFHYIEKLHEYDVIYFDTHASIKNISLGIPYDPDIFNKTYVYQSFVSESGEPFVGISFEYIGTHFTGEKRFKNSLVFVEACNSARRKEFSFAEAFLENGAAVYIGFNNSIPIETLEIPEFVLPFFDRMAIPGISVNTAFENPSPLPYYWNFTCTNRLLNSTFGCVEKSEDNVEVVVYRSEDVDNDPEGFVLVKENLPPTAHIDSITGSDGTPMDSDENPVYYTMDVITFKGSGTDPEGQPITKYTWSFGDGSRQQEGQTVTNIYTKPDTYQVELWVMDSEGGVSAENGMIREIVVVEALPVDNPPPVNQPPKLSVNAPSTVRVNQRFPISYDYSDPDGNQDVIAYHISMSDGTTGTLTTEQIQGATYGFGTTRSHWIEVYVTDTAGNASNHVRINIEVIPTTVENGSPSVLGLNAPGTIGLNQEFSISYNYFDPDGIEDVKYHYYFMSDMSAPERFSVPTGMDFIETPKMFFFKISGLQWIEVYVEDTAGNISLPVRKNIEVMPVAVDTEESVGQAQCETVIKSGSNIPDTYMVELGNTSGTFTFEYDTWEVKDQILVSYEGITLRDTLCVGTEGNKREKISYNGSSTQVMVQVRPNCEGEDEETKWDYTIRCPSR
jgi:PKD repeat protein